MPMWLYLGVISEGRREEHHSLAATPASFASHIKIRGKLTVQISILQGLLSPTKEHLPFIYHAAAATKTNLVM